jgi:hypothetical protein
MDRERSRSLHSSVVSLIILYTLLSHFCSLVCPFARSYNWNFAGPKAFTLHAEHENADRARAERIFKARERREADAPRATADYYAAQQRIRDRTQELRRLRLAREAQEKARAG